MHKDSVKSPELVNALAVVLSDTVTFTFMLSGAHWNVTGSDFSQYHDFFGEIYKDVQGAIDPTAENIRKLGAMAPSKLTDFVAMSRIVPRDCMGPVQKTLGDLIVANSVVIDGVGECLAIADACNEQGIADFLAGRDDMHKKWGWQLSASLDRDELY